MFFLVTCSIQWSPPTFSYPFPLKGTFVTLTAVFLNFPGTCGKERISKTWPAWAIYTSPTCGRKNEQWSQENHDLFDVLEDHFFGKVWRSLVTFLCCRGKSFLRLGVRFEPCLTHTHQTGNVHNEAGKCPQKWWRETKKVQTGQLGWVWPAIQPSDLYIEKKKKNAQPHLFAQTSIPTSRATKKFSWQSSQVFFPSTLLK